MESSGAFAHMLSWIQYLLLDTIPSVFGAQAHSGLDRTCQGSNVKVRKQNHVSDCQFLIWVFNLITMPLCQTSWWQFHQVDLVCGWRLTDGSLDRDWRSSDMVTRVVCSELHGLRRLQHMVLQIFASTKWWSAPWVTMQLTSQFVILTYTYWPQVSSVHVKHPCMVTSMQSCTELYYFHHSCIFANPYASQVHTTA